MPRFLTISSIVTLLILSLTAQVQAAPEKIVRLGYLKQAGADLCRIAAQKKYYRKEGLTVNLIPFKDSKSGLAALEAGRIDVGAFTVEELLRSIARGSGVRIIAGGGQPTISGPLAELDENQQRQLDLRGVMVAIPASWAAEEKGIIIRLTTALIRAYRSQEKSSAATISGTPPTGQATQRIVTLFDPSPDFYRLQRIWNRLDLQTPQMPRDFLARHVYEEIYCDALDRLLLGPIDPVLQKLFSKAVCTPNCCPASASQL